MKSQEHLKKREIGSKYDIYFYVVWCVKNKKNHIFMNVCSLYLHSIMQQYLAFYFYFFFLYISKCALHLHSYFYYSYKIRFVMQLIYKRRTYRLYSKCIFQYDYCC